MDFEHEDLKAKKYQPSISEDYINKGLTLSEIKNNSSVLHGSSVSGIIAAEANNGRGGRGIAFEAHITSLDLNYEDITYTWFKDSAFYTLSGPSSDELIQEFLEELR